MYDFTMFDEIRLNYAIPKLPFLDESKQQLSQEKPYQGLKILHNTPLTLAALFKIEALALGGAEITATCISLLPPEKRAITLLEQANFKVQIEHKFNENFDFHLDCCGELSKVAQPLIGAIELTQTGSKLYQNNTPTYPVLSVDDSKLKVLETFFGTGDGFSRALYTFVGKEMYDKPFVIFGFGKVGRGVLYALKKISNHITVIDIFNKPHLSIPEVTYIQANNKLAVKEAISKAYCAITATGIKQIITDFYGLTKVDFGTCLLTNMGADDEYGENFAPQDVLSNKKPINFSIDEPTAYRYLDPIFYAHNAGIDLILSKQIKPGYNAYPPRIADYLLRKWQSIYNENIDDALYCE
jgi:adenosylhomocysteinase